MVLRLSVLSYKGEAPAEAISSVFDEAGGGVGRTADNTLVLEDPEKFVSRHHAHIRFETGSFLLTDTSLGGTYIDASPTPLHNAEAPLSDGMVLKIGEYELVVEIIEEQSEASAPLSPDFAQTPPSRDFGQAPPPAPESEQREEFDFFQFDEAPEARGIAGISGEHSSPLPEEEEDFSSLLADKFEPDRSSEPSGEEIGPHSSVFNDSFVPPAVDTGVKPFQQIPDDFDFEDLFKAVENEGAPPVVPEPPASPPEAVLPRERVPRPAAPDVAPPPPFVGGTQAEDSPPASLRSPPPADSALFDAFLEGAGLDGLDLKADASRETMVEIGRMFRGLLDGLMAVLRSRAEFKSQFRVSMTTIKPSDNNPLKFSTSVEEAFRNLFYPHQGAFLSPEAAVDEGFRDLMNHQLAMTAGIQAALESLIGRMDPSRFEKQFEQGIVLQKKSKCWDAYAQAYPKFAEELTEDFFGDAFAEAYEEQMRMLKSVREK